MIIGWRTAALVGIIWLQMSWINKAIELKKEEFNVSVISALNVVSDKLEAAEERRDNLEALRQSAHERRPEPAIDPIGVDVGGLDVRRIDAAPNQHRERERRESQQLQLRQNVCDGVRCVFHVERKQGIQNRWKQADADAQHRCDGHRDQHVLRCFLAPDAGIAPKKCEVRDLDP